MTNEEKAKEIGRKWYNDDAPDRPGGRVMNTDREYCTARYNGDKPTYCKYRKTCKRYIEYTLLPKKDRGMLWMCEPLACRESGYSHYVPLPKD